MEKGAFRRARVKLLPANTPSGNTFSSTSFNQISFQIASQRTILLTRSLRLNAQVRLVKSGTGRDGVAPVFPANDPNAAASSLNGAIAGNNYVGAQSMFQTTNISTSNQRTIESVNQVGRYVALSTRAASTGQDMDNINSLGDPSLAKKSVTASRCFNVQHSVSLPIVSGFFQGLSTVDLSEKAFSGIRLDILLARNGQTCSGYNVFNMAGAGADKGFAQTASAVVTTLATPAQGYEYQLTDVSLSFAGLIPSDSMFSKMPSSKMMSIRTINTLESTVLASDQSVNLNFGASNVISVTHSFAPSVWSANPNVDSFVTTIPYNASTSTSLGTPAPIKTVQFMRAGQLFPYSYVLDSEKQAAPDPRGAIQSMIELPAFNSLTMGDNRSGVSISPQTNKGIESKATPSGTFLSLPTTQAADPSSFFCIGTMMDAARHGVSFKTASYTLRIQSQLDDGTTTANSMVTFCRLRQAIKVSQGMVETME